jgi:curli biogenesis system outer membrane secretion channel CsgG
MRWNHIRLALSLISVLGLTACATSPSMVNPALNVNEPLIGGPVIQDIVTPFDRALSCLDGRINRDVLRFSVGAVIDATGKEQLSESGTGKFVTQGAGDIVQSALFQAGVALVNRRDPRVIESEARWGIRDSKTLLSSTFFITGSVNTLDFLPGSGFDVSIAGVGPRARQHRILVGLDLSMTETRTGRVVANVPLQKQIVAAEEGFGVARFFGSTLVNLDVGNRHREALQFAMRQMLHLATFELLTQMMKPEQFIDCWEMVESVHGVLGNTRASNKITQYRASLNARPAQVPGTPNQKPNPVDATPAIETSEQEAETSPAIAEPADTAGNKSVLGSARTDDNKQSGNGSSTAAPSGTYFAEEQTQTTATTATSVATDLPLRMQAEPQADPTPPAPAMVAAAPVAVCPVLQEPDYPSVTPLLSGPAGQSITLTSPKASVVCVANADGAVWQETLQPGIARTFDGTAPWRVQSFDLRLIQIQFQGRPLRMPSYVKDRAELKEKR